MTQAHQARVSDRDPRRANGITASGAMCRTNRSDTWPHQPALQRDCSSLPTEGRPHMGQLQESLARMLAEPLMIPHIFRYHL